MTTRFTNWLTEELQPTIMNTIVYPRLENIMQDVTIIGNKEGHTISFPIEAAYASNAADYSVSTNADVEAGTTTKIKAYWNKRYTHGAAEVPGIDVAENMGRWDEFGSEVAHETKKIVNIHYNNFFTQIKSDIDSAANYSDAALSRSTYTNLQSYEEDSDAQITLALMRGMISGVLEDFDLDMLSEYVCYMERTVYNTFKPLAAANQTWNITATKGTPQDVGFQEVASFDGLQIKTLPGMTTGDVFMIHKPNLKAVNHRPFSIVHKEVKKDATYAAIYDGWNFMATNPRYHGKMTSKD